CTGPAGRSAPAPAQPVELATLPLRGAAGAALPGEDRGALGRRHRRGVVDHAGRGHRRAHALVDDPGDLEHPGPAVDVGLDPVADPHGRRRLGRHAVDPHVPAAARLGGQAPGLVQPHGPQPLVDARLLHGAHRARAGVTRDRPGQAGGVPRPAREPRRRGRARAARRRTAGDGDGGRDGAALEEYRAKRRFDRTSEPPGDGREAAPAPDAARRRDGEGGRLFVVQRHRARRLHYDLRLEVDGTLASWAVPKGPTLDPTVRSLAVHVEDHPIEYADFEGVIPAGEYGGGDVIVWDRGTWTPVGTDDPAAAIAAGELHFDVEAEKLRGRFVLVRTDRDRSRRERWLLLHKGAEHAVPGWDPEDHPRSVKTGRTNDEVAAAPEARWHSDRPPAQAEERLGAARWSPPTAEELAALDALPGRGGRWELQGRALELADHAAVPLPGRDDGEPVTRPPPQAEERLGGARWSPPTAEELAALDALPGRGGRWELQGRALELADLDAVLLPGRDGEEPVTRRDLVRWYATAAPAILPHLVDRPVARRHHPTGGRAAPWRTGLPRSEERRVGQEWRSG